MRFLMGTLAATFMLAATVAPVSTASAMMMHKKHSHHMAMHMHHHMMMCKGTYMMMDMKSHKCMDARYK